MGRHRRRTSHLRRNSVIALTGLVPAGLIAAAHTADADTKIPFLNTSSSAEVESAKTSATATVDTLPKVEEIAEATTAEPEPPALAPVQSTPPLPSSMAEGALGIPGISLDAYQNAERILAVENPTCNMRWTLLAGIGRVESSHANDNKDVDANGTLRKPVIGLPLDGSLPGQAVIMDTDGGELDGDPVYDRAVGPMQFLPSTWKMYGADGNGDGKADPQNLYDAALTTGKYLCDGNLDMNDVTQAAKAIHRYNNSAAYVANVLAWSLGYSTGIVPAASDLPRIH